ncbi:hypothetical protein ACWIWK_03940 [Helicobacter sp. 23-1048]
MCGFVITALGNSSPHTRATHKIIAKTTAQSARADVDFRHCERALASVAI